MAPIPQMENMGDVVTSKHPLFFFEKIWGQPPPPPLWFFCPHVQLDQNAILDKSI